jgi:hypothetical protein
MGCSSNSGRDLIQLSIATWEARERNVAGYDGGEKPGFIERRQVRSDSGVAYIWSYLISRS